MKDVDRNNKSSDDISSSNFRIFWSQVDLSVGKFHLEILPYRASGRNSSKMAVTRKRRAMWMKPFRLFTTSVMIYFLVAVHFYVYGESP